MEEESQRAAAVGVEAHRTVLPVAVVRPHLLATCAEHHNRTTVSDDNPQHPTSQYHAGWVAASPYAGSSVVSPSVFSSELVCLQEAKQKTESIVLVHHAEDRYDGIHSCTGTARVPASAEAGLCLPTRF